MQVPESSFNPFQLLPTLLQLAERRRQEEENAPMEAVRMQYMMGQLASQKAQQALEEQKLTNSKQGQLIGERAAKSGALLIPNEIVGSGPTTQRAAWQDVLMAKPDDVATQLRHFAEQPKRNAEVENLWAETNQKKQNFGNFQNVNVLNDETGQAYFGIDPVTKQVTRIPLAPGTEMPGAPPDKMPSELIQNKYYAGLQERALGNGKPLSKLEDIELKAHKAKLANSSDRIYTMTGGTPEETKTTAYRFTPRNEGFGIPGSNEYIGSSSKPNAPPNQMKQDLNEAALLYDSLNPLLASYDPDFLMYQKQGETWLKSKFEKLGSAPKDDFVKRYQNFKSNLAAVSDTIRKSVTGAAAPFQELKNIYDKWGSLDMSPQQFEGAMEAVKSKAESHMDTIKFQMENGLGATRSGAVMERGKPIDWGKVKGGNVKPLSSEEQGALDRIRKQMGGR